MAKPIIFRKMDRIKDGSYKKEILSAWNENESLEDLTLSEIIYRVKNKYKSFKKNTIYKKIKYCISEGVLIENNGRYHPAMIRNPSEYIAPAFFIKNKYFSKYTHIPVNNTEYLQYYGHKKFNQIKKSEKQKKDFDNALKDLGEHISNGINKFHHKTGEIPILLCYMIYDVDKYVPVFGIDITAIATRNKQFLKKNIVTSSSNTLKSKLFNLKPNFIDDIKKSHILGPKWQDKNTLISLIVPQKELELVYHDLISFTSKERVAEILSKYKIVKISKSNLKYYY